VPIVLHRIQETRRAEGMSLRTAARRLGVDIPEVRSQEQPCVDLRLSQLLAWQRALGVPIAALFPDGGNPDCVSTPR
jgi:transcriptional regulator with XRE-family HTH domain